MREDLIECKLCGRLCKKLGVHIKKKHKISKEDYLEMFPGSVFYICRPEDSERFRKNRIVGWEKCSDEFKAEHGRKFSENLKKKWEDPEYRKEKLKQLSEDAENQWKTNKPFKDKMMKVNRENRKNQILNGTTKSGLKKFKFNNRELYFRSYLDFCIYKNLLELFDESEFKYESLWIKYYDSQKNKFRHYVPDFYVPKYNLIIEGKYEEYLQDINVLDKMNACKDNYKYLFITEKDLHPYVFKSLIQEIIVK